MTTREVEQAARLKELSRNRIRDVFPIGSNWWVRRQGAPVGSPYVMLATSYRAAEGEATRIGRT